MNYENDIVAWSNEQATFLRARRFDMLDLVNLADEIEDVGKREQRDLASRIAALLSNLLLIQPGRPGQHRVIREQRTVIRLRLTQCPSLRLILNSEAWQSEIWSDAVALAASESGLYDFPESCPWPLSAILADEPK